VTPREYGQRAATTFNANNPGHFPGRPLFEGVVARAVEEAVAAERERWSGVCEALEVGQFRSEWLAEADRIWAERFENPPAANGDRMLMWVARCRELLREMVALQQAADFFRSGEE
jgi:hypothetical protein